MPPNGSLYPGLRSSTADWGPFLTQLSGNMSYTDTQFAGAYALEDKLGEGSSGEVFLAVNVDTGNEFAIKRKKKKVKSEKEAENLTEIQALKKLKHSNIRKMEKFFVEDGSLYLLFELMDKTLADLIKEQDDGYQEAQIQSMASQMLKALNYMHKKGANFHIWLVQINPKSRSFPPKSAPVKYPLQRRGRHKNRRLLPGARREEHKIRSHFVSDRWYRAPEILLLSTDYNWQVDMWALGCIVSEFYLLKALFPGSSDNDQLLKIASIIGVPTKEEWPEGYKLAEKTEFSWPTPVKGKRKGKTYETEDGDTIQVGSLEDAIPGASKEALKLLSDILNWNPTKRPTTAQVLKSKFMTQKLEMEDKKNVGNRSLTPDVSSRGGSTAGSNSGSGSEDSGTESNATHSARPDSGRSGGSLKRSNSLDGGKDRKPVKRGQEKSKRVSEKGRGRHHNKPPIDPRGSKNAKPPEDLVLKLHFEGPSHGSFVVEPENK